MTPPDAVPAGPPAAAARTRRLDLDRAKGAAILLVVFGHVVARDAPAGVEWYEPLRWLVYRFHMPFFLYLSGYAAWLAGALLVAARDWPALTAKRAQRLLLPFLLFGLLVLAGKLAAGPLIHVDNPPEGLLGGLRDLVWTTGDSPATMVWYLWVLFLASLVAPALLWLGIGLPGLVLLGVALYAVGLPPVAYLDRFAAHAVFFAAGAWTAARGAGAMAAVDAYQPLWWALFAATLAAAAMGVIPEGWTMLACGLAAAPALHGLVRRPPLGTARWPVRLGAYAMAIYLFNTIAIGLAKAGLIALGIGWTAEGFWVHAPVLMAAGVAGPVALKILVLRRSRALDRMTD